MKIKNQMKNAILKKRSLKMNLLIQIKWMLKIQKRKQILNKEEKNLEKNKKIKKINKIKNRHNIECKLEVEKIKIN